ncbi:glycosyltransferase [Saxibacter everestensis]|uniref:Glycosyltransferase n=1 Tax=Saxibacter everestensis TaxID=2909229 RepID=A0ABY8QV75_9MICO|nr:glycosyltransferase [Brevibacteriaceae bacterium ZFBP1038]
MRILLWHVHGAWTEAFVQGRHQYLLPWTPEGGQWGLGRGGRDWPNSAREVDPEQLRNLDVDAVVLQRPEEVAEVERLLGRRAGKDMPAVFVEHNTPRGDIAKCLHPLSDQSDIPIVHVTHFNDVYWDSGRAATTVIEHGIKDPGDLYSGVLPNLGVVINDPVRRWRITGTDLLPRFADAGRIDVFGMGGAGLPEQLGLDDAAMHVHGDLPGGSLYNELAKRRVYLHPFRWTSLGLALLEAMHLGMPVVALAATEAIRAVPPEAGAISTNIDELCEAAEKLIADPAEARARGRVAREVALTRYNLADFLRRWDEVLTDIRPTSVTGRAPGEGRP